MTYPTPRAVYAALAGVPAALAATLFAESAWPLWVVYAGALAMLIIVDAALSPGAGRIAVTARSPAVLFIGDTESLDVRIEQDGSRRQVSFDVVGEVDDLLEPPPATQAVSGPDGAALTALALRPRQRGVARVEAVWLRWRGPLGLVARHRRCELARELKVVPNVRAVRQSALTMYAPESGTGTRRHRDLGSGSEFESLREYVPGLDRRWIDWKQTARHRKLMCKEFQVERDHPIVFAFDTGHAMADPLAGLSRLDWAINASLQMAYVSARSGDRIGVLGFDAQVRLYSEPVGGDTGFRRFHQVIAELDSYPEETNYTRGMVELSARLRRRSLVVLFTDLIDSTMAELLVANMGRLAATHQLLFVCLRSPELDRLREPAPRVAGDVVRCVVARHLHRDREVVLARLRRLGIVCVDAAPDQINADLLNAYLWIKERELV